MYELQWYNKPESKIQKYKSTGLYLLYPYIFPHEPVNTLDARFKNYSQAPLVSPLHKKTKTEIYNDMNLQQNKVIANRDLATLGLDDIGVYIACHQNTVAQYIGNHTNM